MSFHQAYPCDMKLRANQIELVAAVADRVIQATLILQHFGAGHAKAFRGAWLKFSNVLYTQVQGVYRTDFAAWCLRTFPVWSWTVMQWTALLFELEAPVLFCVRKLHIIGSILGMGFLLMIALMMKDLIFFSLQMWSFYALFVTADEWCRLGRFCMNWMGRRPVLETSCVAPR